MTVRKIPKNYRNVTGVSSHLKANRQAAFESTLERDFYTLLEFDPQVKLFDVQPLAIYWVDPSGQEHRYTPDVLVVYQDYLKLPSCIFEVKYRKDLITERRILLPKIKAAIHYCRTHNMHYKIATERIIRTEACATAKFLLPFLRRAQAYSAEERILEALSALRQTTPQTLLSHMSQNTLEQAEILPALWSLIAKRKVGCNLDKRIHMESEIWHALQ